MIKKLKSYLPMLALAFVAVASSLFFGHDVQAAIAIGLLGSTLSVNNPTLLDLAKTLDPNGTAADIVEILNATNEVLDDMSWQQGNLTTGNRTAIRSGIPAPTWRKLYGGVQPNKSRVVQVTDSCGMLEAYAEVDKALADMAPDLGAFRLQEDSAHIEGISQEVASKIFYGNEALVPETFTGFSPRFNSLSAENADNIVNAAGAGSDNTSIWLCVWGPKTGFGIVPKGSKAGLQVTDKGQVTIENADGSNGRMEAYRTHYRMDAGLTIRDWRYFVRICNIDVSDQTTLANTKNLVQWMTMATERIPSFGMGRACFYMNRNMREKLRLGILEKTANNLSWETVAGKRVMVFDDIPVKRCDALLNTETVVS